MRKLTTAFTLAIMLLGPAVQAASSAEGQLLGRLNQIRATGVTCPGSGPRPATAALQPADLHAVSALKQASYMAQSGAVSHIGPGGTTPRVRAASSGIRSVSVTEIIYMGSGLNPEAAIQWWLHSPVHCYYMTDARYTTAGASIVRGNRGTAYVMVLTSAPK
ncbi:CAP domain-containing protein [Deinococcus sp. UYEF24]